MLNLFQHPTGRVCALYDLQAGSSELCFVLELNDSPAQLPRRLVFFVLIQKGPKKSRQKKASPRRPDSLARFSVVPVPASNYMYAFVGVVYHSCLEDIIFLS